MVVLSNFWRWYEKHHKLNTAIAAILFALQLVHLYWLTTAVVIRKIFGFSLFPETDPLLQLALIFVDYTEIPALITASLVYIRLQMKKKGFKNILYLFFINIQFIHIFWITDEYVVEIFTGHPGFAGLALGPIFAWVAIGIDYLELPVIYETLREAFKNIKRVSNISRL